MTRDEYWVECVSIALNDAGISASREQILEIAGAVQGCHENIGMSFGDDVASANWCASQRREVDDAKKALRHEVEKVVCRSCGGHGRLKYNAGPWAVNTECDACRGDGKVHPSKM